MMHTSKLILVPSELAQNQNSADNVLVALESEMRKLLDDRKIPADSKLTSYSQLMHRYVKLDEQRKQPFKIEVQEPQVPKIDETVLLEDIPTKDLKNARILVKEIQKKSRIEWNDAGEVIIDGVKIAGANIIDLLHDFSRSIRPHNPAVGAEVFARALKKGNIDENCIGNKYRRKLLNSGEEVVYATPVSSRHNTPQASDLPRRHRRANRRVIGWEEQ